VRLLEDLVRDLRFAVRALRFNPGFTVAAVVTLALAIGTNASVFSVVNGLIIRPFPVHAPDRLVALWNVNPNDGGANGLAYDDYVDWRDRSGIFGSLAAQMNAPLSLAERAGTEVVWSEIVSSNYFATLGLAPHLGRFFQADEATRPGAAPYAVLGYDLWQRQFAGDASIVGRDVRINRIPVEVIGVAPRHFHGIRRFGFWSELWIPLGAPGTESLMRGRGSGPLIVVGRLPAGVDVERAEARASAFARALSEVHPESNRGFGAMFTSARTPFDSPRNIPPRVLQLAAALGLVGVGLVLLIACANVANLMLARASARRREMAVRLSIGSGRSRLIRQLMTESALLSLLGGLFALPIAALAERWQGTMLPQLQFRVGLIMTMDHRVLLFTAFMAFLAVFLFGLAPALQATRLDLVTALRGHAGRLSSRRIELRSVLVGVQIAVSAVLLITGTLFLRSLRASGDVDFGLDPVNRLVISANPESHGYDVERARTYFRSAVQRVRELPGVTNAAWAFPVPFDTYDRSTALYVEGVTDNRDSQTADVNLSTADPRFFEVAGIPLLSGREFTPGDSAGAPRVMVITRATAELFWPGRPPLGQRVRIDGPTGQEITVVGVVEDVVFAPPAQRRHPHIFFPNDQTGSKSMGLSLIVHARDDAAALIPRVRGILQSIDAEVATYGAITMERSVRNALNAQFSAVVVAGTLAVLALVLALVGLYGVVAYTVARSTRDIGIRIALGATPASVIRLFMIFSARTTAIGLGCGLLGAFAIGRAVASILYGVSSSDPLTFVTIPLALAMVASLASYLPARRATRVPPVLALRQD
jgi:predicted permease